MGILAPSIAEVKMQCEAIEEALNLFGEPVTIWLPEAFDLYQNIRSEFRGFITNVILKDNPSQRILNNLGFLQEFNQKTDMLCYLPYSLNGKQVVIKDKSVIEFRDKMLLRVNSINTNYFYGVFYVLHCSPFVQDNQNINRRQIVGASNTYLTPDQNEFGG